MQENTRWYSLAVIAHACRLGPQMENSRAKHSTENYYSLSIKYFTGKRLLTKRYFSWRVFFFFGTNFFLLFWTFQVRKIKRTGHHLSEGGEGEKSLENIGCVTIELTWSPLPPTQALNDPLFPSLAVNWLIPPPLLLRPMWSPPKSSTLRPPSPRGQRRTDTWGTGYLSIYFCNITLTFRINDRQIYKFRNDNFSLDPYLHQRTKPQTTEHRDFLQQTARTSANDVLQTSEKVFSALLSQVRVV